MELKCPQCGKWMAVSQEELVMHDCQVVCPQCLSVCQYEGGALVVRNDSDAPYRHNAVVESSKTETARFCHSCGKQLPEGISFCPYCGADLSAPFEAPKPEPEPVVEPTPKPQQSVAVKQETPTPAVTHQESKNMPHRESSTRVEDKLRTMTHHYHSARPYLHQNGTMPGKTFKLVAYAIILLLLIVLVAIIVSGLNIEPATM